MFCLLFKILLVMSVGRLLEMYTSERTFNSTDFWYYGVRAVRSTCAPALSGAEILWARNPRTHPHVHMLTYANALVDAGAGCIYCARMESLPFRYSIMGC